jgi:hypothetical protein
LVVVCGSATRIEINRAGNIVASESNKIV